MAAAFGGAAPSGLSLAKCHAAQELHQLGLRFQSAKQHASLHDITCPAHACLQLCCLLKPALRASPAQKRLQGLDGIAQALRENARAAWPSGEALPLAHPCHHLVAWCCLEIKGQALAGVLSQRLAS